MTEDTPDDGGSGDLSIRDTDVTYEIDDGERHSEAVVRAVASLTNTPALDVEPLYEVIDPEYLDGVFDDTEDGASVESSLTFDFEGCQVAVTGDVVHVRERDGDDS